MPNSNLGDIIQQPIDDVAIVEYSCDSERTFSFRDVHELANGFASLVLVEQGLESESSQITRWSLSVRCWVLCEKVQWQFL